MTNKIPLVMGADGLPQQLQNGDSLYPSCWIDYASLWDSPPVVVGSATINGNAGSVYSYTLLGATTYRFVPTNYSSLLDGFYSSYSNGVLTGLICVRG